MMNRRSSLIALVLLVSVLIGVSIMPPAPVSAMDNQHLPPITGWTKLAPGIWYNETIKTIDSGTYAKQGVNLEYVLYVFNNTIYGVRISTDYNVTTSEHAYFYHITIVSDPDESLAQAPRRITGDEVYVDTTALLTNGSYSAVHDRTFTWYRKTILLGWQQLAPAQITALNSSLYQQSTNMSNTIDQRRYYAWGWSYLMRDQTRYHYGSPYAFYTYHIDQAFLPHFAKNATAFEMTVMGLRHRLMGLVAYNDTNTNNIMDIKYGKIGNYRGPVSLEAKYVFKVFFVNSVAKQSPTYNSGTGSVDWSMSMQGVNGSLVGVSPTILDVNTTIDEVKFAFHFTRTSNVAKVKVDEHIGTFSIAGTPPVNGLSLAIAYFSFFESLTVNRYRMNMTTSAGPISSESNSTLTTKLNITGDGTNSAEIGIGGDTYIWGKDNSTQTAYSNILPWFFFRDQFTTVGDFSVTNVDFNASMYFYEACFPQWSGYSITHDPYFAVTTYTIPSSEIGVLPTLIMAGVGIGVALAAVTILMIRRRRMQGTASITQQTSAL